LAARGQDVAKASQALRKTLQWRKEYRPEAIMFDDVSGCASGGRVEVLQELDKHKRPILLYRLRCVPLTHLSSSCKRQHAQHALSPPSGSACQQKALTAQAVKPSSGVPLQVFLEERDDRGGVHSLLGVLAGVRQQDGR
jgi:hypothetical protein